MNGTSLQLNCGWSPLEMETHFNLAVYEWRFPLPFSRYSQFPSLNDFPNVRWISYN
jgi:hypothetical protein